MSRNANDLYPTTPCAAIALREYFRSHRMGRMLKEPWLDPAAGFGTLLEWFGVARAQCHALELSCSELQHDELVRRVHSGQLRVGVDALMVDWVPGANVVMNPPFNQLEDFVRRALSRDGALELLTCVLTPVGFWHAQSRRDLPAPNRMLALTWRPNFTCGFRVDGGDGSGPSQDYVWAIYDGTTKATVWERLPYPNRVPRELVAEHRRLASMSCGIAPAELPLLRPLSKPSVPHVYGYSKHDVIDCPSPVGGECFCPVEPDAYVVVP